LGGTVFGEMEQALLAFGEQKMVWDDGAKLAGRSDLLGIFVEPEEWLCELAGDLVGQQGERVEWHSEDLLE